MPAMIRLLGPLSLLLTYLVSLSSASPLLRRQPVSPAKPYIVTRSPVSADAFADDWPSNVIMVGGAEQYGLWVPQDGDYHDLSNILCLDMPAYSIVTCSTVTIDNIGVVEGYGPCTFYGSSGWSQTVSGADGSGYMTVGPPQTISWATCS